MQTDLPIASPRDYAEFFANCGPFTHAFALTTRHPVSTDRLIQLLHDRFDGVWGGQIDHEAKRYIAVVERGVDRPHIHGVILCQGTDLYPGSVLSWFKDRIWPYGDHIYFARLRKPAAVYLRYSLKGMNQGYEPTYVISRAIRRRRLLGREEGTAV